MVNAHGKFPGGATNSANNRTDGSKVRDATTEEKTRDLNANQHKRKKAVDAASSDEQSQSSTGLVPEAPPKARSVSICGERSGGDASSGDRGGGNRKKDKECESSRRGDDRDDSRKRESREPERRKETAANGEDPDDEEADRSKMIQGRIEDNSDYKNEEIK